MAAEIAVNKGILTSEGALLIQSRNGADTSFHLDSTGDFFEERQKPDFPFYNHLK